MKIPEYIQQLLGYATASGIHTLIHQITDYQKYDNSIAGYLYRMDLEKYKYPSCFNERIERFAKWCRRMGAEVIVHKVVIDGWQSYAVLSITDPVSLVLEKSGYIR